MIELIPETPWIIFATDIHFDEVDRVGLVELENWQI